MSSSWGYSTWDCHWYGSYGAYYHGTAYYGNSAWHGGYYGSSASAYGAYGSAHASEGYNPFHRHVRARRVNFNRLRHAKSRTGLQPIHRSVRRDPSRFQRLFELGKLHGLEERHHCGHATLLGCQRNRWHSRKLQRQQVRDRERQRLQEHRKRLGGLEFEFQRRARLGKQQRFGLSQQRLIVRFQRLGQPLWWRLRLGLQIFELAGLEQPRWRRWMGRRRSSLGLLIEHNIRKQSRGRI